MENSDSLLIKTIIDKKTLSNKKKIIRTASYHELFAIIPEKDSIF